MESATRYLVQIWQPPGSLNEAVQIIKDVVPGQMLGYTLIGLVAYPTIVSLLRFRRLRKLHEKYNYPTRESMAHMTDNDAWEIQTIVAQLEFPFIYIKSLQFALFRTYGIPTISSLLAATTQFSNPRTALKRYTDTTILIGEFIAFTPISDRARSAIARTNYLHSGFRNTGKILDDDMLYTLSLFALEPIRFIDTYEWRKLSELEKCAIGTYWKSLGDALKISYEVLPSYKAGFRDGLHWLEELDEWRIEYEKEKMVPNQKNKEIADQTTAILLYTLPEKMKHVGYKFVSYMMDDRLRTAMMYGPPPPSYSKLFSAVLAIRKFFLRYLALPRPYFLRYLRFSEQQNQYGRFYATEWDVTPYYVQPTLLNRWGLRAWLTWALSLPVPGDEGDKYYPKGYYIPDLGPKYQEGKGREEVEEMKADLRKERTGKCPFH